MKTCNVKKMEEYLDNFNPIREKYDVFKSCEATITTPVVYAEGARFDNAYQYGPLTKQEYSGIQQNLHLVYGNDETVKQDIRMYYQIKDKIIQGYLALPLLSQMFDEDYFDFEWDMHVGQNFTEHRGSCYRDHFIHQVRNMYMMDTLLDDGFYKATMSALANRKNGKIAEYTCLKLEQFLLDKSSKEYQLFGTFLKNVKEDLSKECYGYTLDRNDHTIEIQRKRSNHAFIDHLESYRGYYDVNQYHGEVKDNAGINENGNQNEEDTKRKLKESISQHTLTTDDYAYHYFYNYVIHAAAYMSALFHDMGYPICHYLEVRSRLSKYNPSMYMVTQNTTGSFDNIASKLSDSLLFTIVSHDEIKKRLEWTGSKYDHGAYSAIAFLLQYYETGAILRLSPEKQCAFELAAIAIYNHTMDYACADKDPSKSKRNYYKPYFKQNPISFLLHFCDDLEEWDRRYFEISDAPAVSICSTCGGVLMPHIDADSDDPEKKKIWHRDAAYRELWGNNTYPAEVFDCFCSNTSSSHKCFRRQVFHKRQIFLVSTSPEVDFELNDSLYVAHIRYDYFRLLKMSQINNTYAKYRLKDIKELKCRSSEQNYAKQEKDLKFNDIFIDCFMTANPLLIKIKLIENVLLTKDIDFSNVLSDGNYSKSIDEDEISSMKKKGEGDEIEFIINGNDLTNTLKNFSVIVNRRFVKTETWESINKRLFSNKSYGEISDYLVKDCDSSFTRLDFYVSLLYVCSELNKKFSEYRKKLVNLKDLTSKNVKKAQEMYGFVVPYVCDIVCKEFLGFWIDGKEDFYKSVLSELIWDCLYQYARELRDSSEKKVYLNPLFLNEYKTLYMTHKEHEDAFYDAVLKYCCDTNEFNQYYKDKNNQYIGYFGDLFFFEKLNDLMYD